MNSSPDTGDSLTDKTRRSVAWTTLASVLAKVVALGAQLVFARFLAPEAYGLLALVGSIGAVLAVLQQGGLTQVLISRPRRIQSLLGVATSTSVILGSILAGAVTIASPWLAQAFDESQLIVALPCFALSIFFASAGAPAQAFLQAKFRFWEISVLEIVSAILRAVLSAVFIVLGFDELSLIIPIPIVALVNSVAGWKVAGIKPLMKFSRRSMSALIVAGMPLAAAQLVLLATWHGDYVIVQSFLDTGTLGIYFLAFNLSTQFFLLISQNASRVLFAGLSQLSLEPIRQTAAFVRAAKDLASLAFPISFLQVLLADPGVKILFKEQYHGMIPIIQILSIGLAFRCVGSPAGALLQSRRKFSRLFVLNCIYSTFFLVAVCVGTAVFGVIGTACAATSYFVLLGPVHILASVAKPGELVRETFQIFIGPTVSASIALVVAMFVQSVSASVMYDVLAAFVATVVFTIGYCVISYLAFPQNLDAWNRHSKSFRSRLGQIWSQRRAARGSSQ
ncbi:MAG: oligosaccharide flippase family protein [Planctomycetales bacterium]|nr:oligosaccharide flippase family protein [Planctomycetales bacterium]